MNKYLIILGGLMLSILLGIIGYFFFLKKSDTVWNFISEEAYFVYERPENLSDLKEITTTKFWIQNKKFSTIHHFLKLIKHIDKGINDFKKDTKNIKNNDFGNELKHIPFFLAGFPIKTNELGWVAYLNLENKEIKEETKTILKYLFLHQKVKREERIYNEISIFSFISETHPEMNLSFLFHNDFLVCSPHRELVEETARLMKPANYFSVKTLQKVIDEGQILIHQSEMKYGKIHFQVHKFDKVALLFGLEKDDFFLNHGFLSRYAIAEFQFTDTKFTLKGQLYPNSRDTKKDDVIDTENYYLSVFDKQKPINFHFENWIPNHTEQVIHWALSNPLLWFNHQKRYFSSLKDNRQVTINQFEKKYNLSFQSFVQQLTGELSLIYVEPYDKNFQDKILICGTKSKQKMLNYLISIQNKVVKKPLIKDYSTSQVIYQLEIENFPQNVLGPSFNHFNQSYFTFIEDYLIIANNDLQLKEYLNRLNRKEVWSNRQNFEFLNEVKKHPSQLKYIVNTKDYYDSFAYKSENIRNVIVKNHKERLKNLDYIFAEITHQSPEKNEFNLSFYFKNDIQELDNQYDTMMKELKINSSIKIDSLIITPPFILPTNENKELQMLFQDQSKIFYYFKNNKLGYKRELYGTIQDKIFGIQGGNDALKTVFITTDSLFILKKNGENWSNYPIQPSDNIKFTNLSVFKTKKKEIQLLVSTIDGKIYKYNELGIAAEGWNPKTVENRLSAKITNIQKNEIDFYIFSTSNGQLYVSHSDGTDQVGFPIDMKYRINSPLFIRHGINVDKTVICLVTENGVFSKINLVGRELARTQMIKHAVNAKFYLVNEEYDRNFIIVEKVDNFVYFYNQNGILIFEKQLYLGNEFSFQFYHLEKGEVYYIVNDELQKITYIYDARFTLLGGIPINSIGKVALNFDKNKIYIYRNFKNNSDVLLFEKP